MANLNEKGISEERESEVKIDRSAISVIASMIGMILVTIALGGVRTYWIAALSVVAVGMAILLEPEMPSSGNSHMNDEPRNGLLMTTGRLPGGIAGILLGVLSLFGVFTRILLPISCILFGLVLTLGSWGIVRLHDVYITKACEREETRAMLRAAGRVVGALELFIGCGSIALGILALTVIGITPVSLTLIATFGIGFSSFLNGIIFSGRMLSTLRCDRLSAV